MPHVLLSLALAAICIAPAVPSPAHAKKPSKRDISVVDSRLLYLPDQLGGPYHTATFVLRNRSVYRAEDVGGQVSVYAADGELIKTFHMNRVTIQPRGKAVLSEDALKLPVANGDGRMKLHLRVGGFVRPKRKWPFTVETLAYRVFDEFEFGSCGVSGVIRNVSRREHDNVQVTIATHHGGRVLSSTSEFIDDLVPGLPQTFEADFVSPSECPSKIDGIIATAQDPY